MAANTKKTVLFLMNRWQSSAGGIQTVNRKLACATARCAPELECVALVCVATPEEEADASGAGVTLIAGAAENDWKSVFQSAELAALRSEDVVAVVGHSYFSGQQSAELKEKVFPQARSFHVVHMSPLATEALKEYRSQNYVEERERRLAEELNIAVKADVVLCIGPRLTLYMKHQLGSRRASQEVVRLDCGIESIEDAAAPAQPTLLCLGRADSIAVKGLDIFARAAAHVSSQWATNHATSGRATRPQFVVRGAKEKPEELERLLREQAGASARAPSFLVRPYTTDQSMLDSDFRGASLFIMPSREEGFGLVACEAISMGVPVIISEASGLADLIGEVAKNHFMETQRCIISHDGDLDTIARRYADAAMSLLLDEERARKYVGVLRDRLLPTCSWDAAARKLVSLIDAASSPVPVSVDAPPATPPVPSRSASVSARGAARSATRTPPRLEELIVLPPASAQEWLRLITLLGVLSPPPKGPDDFVSNAADPYSFSRAVGSERDVVACIPGTGHVLSKREIESASLKLEYEEYRSYTIVSLGTIAEDARTAYSKLSKRKSLKVMHGKEVIAQLAGSLPDGIRRFLDSLDAAEHSAVLVLSAGKSFICLIDRLQESYFFVVNDQGAALPESDPIVAAVRRTRPSLEKARYGEATTPSTRTFPQNAAARFDRAAYLKACDREFGSTRYAALAAVGFRLPDLPLQDLYVEPTADLGVEAATTAAVSRTVDDFLKGLKLSASIRAEVEAQLRRGLGGSSIAESGAARALYQQHGSVAVLGDPGSGKTCFVKYELLEFARHTQDDGSWYGRHVPLYVPLAEAALVYSKNVDLLETACMLAGRQGLPIALNQVREEASAGRIAFFFDGLDEVVSIDQRSALMDAISELFDSMASLGNRFVLTSRPAAVQSVILPPALATLFLRGLTEEEMGRLARRILAYRLADTRNGASLEDAKSSKTDDSIVGQLLNDVRTVPGIRRLATNPLLLTLLVMIYANSGRPSAKRHRVYHQAVQTLVTVRSWTSNQRPLSEADLRRRLGTVAVAVFRDPKGAVPTFARVRESIQAAMTRERGVPVSEEEAAAFVQSVAESTGLLVLHETASKGDDSRIVTFMHHSFLEYYGAQGLKASSELSQIPALATQPRWREVILIFAGLLGDEGDVSDLIAALLDHRPPGDEITLEQLLFAFDCVLESEVPPDRAQRLLFKALSDSLREGAARYDDDLRSEIGRRVARFAASTPSDQLDAFLINGLEDKDAFTCAAFVDVLGYAACDSDLTERMKQAFGIVCARKEPEVVTAVCESLGEARSIRTTKAIQVLRAAFDGQSAERLAASRAVERAPALAKDQKVWDKLVQALRKESPFIARSAASGLLSAGVRVGMREAEERRLLLDILRMLQEEQTAEGLLGLTVPCSRAEIEAGLASAEQEERLLAIRVLPWLADEDEFVHSAILSAIRTEDPSRRLERVAALQSLRFASRAQRLLRVSEIDSLRQLLDAPTQDVRTAACQVLGVVGFAPETAGQVGQELVEYVSTRDRAEFRAGVRALGQYAAKDEAVRSWLLLEAKERLAKSSGKQNRTLDDFCEVLRACQQLDGAGDRSLWTGLLSAAKDYRRDEAVRQQCWRTFAALCPPTKEMTDAFIKALDSPMPTMADAVADAALRFAARCRRRVEFVREVGSRFEALETALLKLHAASMKRLGYQGGGLLGTLRKALEETQQVIRAFKQIEQRKAGAKPSGSAAPPDVTT